MQNAIQKHKTTCFVMKTGGFLYVKAADLMISRLDYSAGERASDSGHGSQNINFHSLNTFLHIQTLIHVHICEATIMGAHDAVGFACQQELHSQVAHLGSVDTVTGIGHTATLNVTENSHTRIQVNCLFNLSGDIIGGASTFRNHNHVVREAIETSLTNFLNHIPLEVDFLFRNQDRGGAHSQTHIHGQVAGVTTHNLNHRAPLMGLHRVTQFIDALNGGIGCSVESDTVMGAADVIIDGARDTDDIDAILGQSSCATEGAVAADGNDAIQAQELTGGNSLALAFFGHEFLAASSVEDGAATIDGVGNTLFVQFNDVAGNQTIPATADSVALNAMVQGSTDNSTNTGIHAGGIAAAGENANSLNTHDEFLLKEIVVILHQYCIAKWRKCKDIFRLFVGTGRGLPPFRQVRFSHPHESKEFFKLTKHKHFSKISKTSTQYNALVIIKKEVITMNKNDQEFLVQKIRTQYTEKELAALDDLKKLDSKVKRPANMFAYIFGSISAIIMGAGMSLVMTDIGEIVGIANSMVSGIVIGVVGMLMAAINYPVYMRFLGSRRKKYADKIIALSDKIMSK